MTMTMITCTALALKPNFKKMLPNKKDEKIQMTRTTSRRRSNPANHQRLDFEDSVIGNGNFDLKINKFVHFAYNEREVEEEFGFHGLLPTGD